jgi:hypothetical protein
VRRALQSPREGAHALCDMKRGLYRYETAPGRWWACVEDDDARVNIIRERYEQMQIEPEFWRLPVESNGKERKTG